MTTSVGKTGSPIVREILSPRRHADSTAKADEQSSPVTAVALLVALYFGSYYAMIVPDQGYYDINWATSPVYRSGGDWASLVYAPAFA